MNKLLISVNSSGNKVVEQFRTLIENDYKKYDQIVVRLTEPGLKYNIHNTYYSFINLIEEYMDKNIIYYGCNFTNSSKKLPLYFINYMFHAGIMIYNTDSICVRLLKECLPFHKKSKTNKKWDFLMGGKNIIKDQLYKDIQSHTIHSDVFLTYYRNDVKSGYWSSFVKIPKNHTAETIYDRFTNLLRYSDLIDPEIYNQTFYTALIETVIDPNFGVFTEKTAKPIVAKRPFVVFGSPGQLKALQQLGFKTFSSVMDESYDLELDMNLRFKKVLKTMKELNEKDPYDVYRNLETILEHNKKHFEQHNWNTNFLKVIKECNNKIDLNNFDV